MRNTVLVALLLMLLVSCGPSPQVVIETDSDGYNANTTIISVNPYVYRVVDREYGNVCYVKADSVFCMPLER